MKAKRVTILTGHYGSGKTSIAVAFSLSLHAEGNRVTICDLDIVNPYFRTTDHRRELEQNGVQLVTSPFAGSNLDIPALPKELYAAIADSTGYAVLDVGGDDRGAVALGRYVPDIVSEGDYELFFVTNFYRPLTRTAEDALGVLREVETACGMKATALVNNSNLGRETVASDVLGTIDRMAALSERARLPVVFTAADVRLKNELEGKLTDPFWMEF
ncbi:MAG: hypothetical protein VB034_04890 [Eubacteriales bacterium]|nr:hypothetical protein [Eubacteriales bacterium]